MSGFLLHPVAYMWVNVRMSRARRRSGSSRVSRRITTMI